MNGFEDLEKHLQEFGAKAKSEADKLKPAIENAVENVKPFIAEQLSRASEVLSSASAKILDTGNSAENTSEEKTADKASIKQEAEERFAAIQAAKNASDPITEFFKSKHE